MDSRPSRRNKAAFSNFSGEVLTSPGSVFVTEHINGDRGGESTKISISAISTGCSF